MALGRGEGQCLPGEADQSSCALPKHIRLHQRSRPHQAPVPRSPFPHWPRADGSVPEAPLSDSCWRLRRPPQHLTPCPHRSPGQPGCSGQATRGEPLSMKPSLPPAVDLAGRLCLWKGAGGPHAPSRDTGQSLGAFVVPALETHTSVLGGLGWPPGVPGDFQEQPSRPPAFPELGLEGTQGLGSRAKTQATGPPRCWAGFPAQQLPLSRAGGGAGSVWGHCRPIHSGEQSRSVCREPCNVIVSPGKGLPLSF